MGARSHGCKDDVNLRLYKWDSGHALLWRLLTGCVASSTAPVNSNAIGKLSTTLALPYSASDVIGSVVSVTASRRDLPVPVGTGGIRSGAEGRAVR